MSRKRGPLRVIVCPACVTRFETTDSRKAFCSALCHQRFHSVQRIHYRNCRTCGRLFVAGGNRWNAVSCSSRCRHAARLESSRADWARNYERAKRLARRNTALRRARMKGVEVERFSHEQVFDRDGWCCHLCRKPINPTLRRPNPGAATLDHIIPLSLGGPHTLANVAAAHAWCNQSKNNRPAGEQLRMIG